MFWPCARWTLLGVIAFSLTLPGSVAATIASQGNSAVLAGLATVDVTPAIGVPVAGCGITACRLYPFFPPANPFTYFFKPSLGVRDPILSKALVLQSGSRKLLVLSLDLIFFTRQLKQDLLARIAPLGFTPDNVVVSAVHTHSGPGDVVQNDFWDLIIADRFDPVVYDRFMAGVVQSVEQAMAAMEPSQLVATSFQAQNLQRNRRGQTGYFDSTANLLMVKSEQGQWRGGIVNFAIHGTALPTGNEEMSADVPGGIEHAMEKALASLNPPDLQVAPTVLFLNGAEGDVSPIRKGDSAIDEIGGSFAQQALAALAHAHGISPQWSERSLSVDIGSPDIDLKICMNGGLDAGITDNSSTLPPQHLFSASLDFPASVSLSAAFPSHVGISLIQLGDLVWMTWPGEPLTSIGFKLKALALQAGYSQAWVLGLTNDYTGYYTLPKDYEAGGYEACASLYGPDAGMKLVDGFGALLMQLVDHPPESR